MLGLVKRRIINLKALYIRIIRSLSGRTRRRQVAQCINAPLVLVGVTPLMRVMETGVSGHVTTISRETLWGSFLRMFRNENIEVVRSRARCSFSSFLRFH